MEEKIKIFNKEEKFIFIFEVRFFYYLDIFGLIKCVVLDN